ncbi:hypothetical protein TCAL_15150 [Tigriopus californicus]|uniref:Uncharacterized protein n=1 Tax=Tigriopus californicus TaxID=6832 RepID=A0A553NVT4_TIGCA|nr:hypothetical protein TCAL_15150 [Tigriopus californicus]
MGDLQAQYRHQRDAPCLSVMECMSAVGRSISFRYLLNINQIADRWTKGDLLEEEREAEVEALRAKLVKNKQISAEKVSLEKFKQSLLESRIKEMRGEKYQLRPIPSLTAF